MLDILKGLQSFMSLLIKVKSNEEISNELGIRVIDPDDDFMVLKVLSGKNAGGEIFFDRKTIRFLFKSKKSVVLLTSIECIELDKDGFKPSHFLLKVRMVDNEHNQNSVPVIGYIAENERSEIIEYLEKIKIMVTHSSKL